MANIKYLLLFCFVARCIEICEQCIDIHRQYFALRFATDCSVIEAYYNELPLLLAPVRYGVRLR